MSDDLFKLPCVECEQPMKGRGSRVTFEGDNSIHAFRFECQNACQTTAEVAYTSFIPVDIAARRNQ